VSGWGVAAASVVTAEVTGSAERVDSPSFWPQAAQSKSTQTAMVSHRFFMVFPPWESFLLSYHKAARLYMGNLLRGRNW
jgi:hypothetical protein